MYKVNGDNNFFYKFLFEHIKEHITIEMQFRDVID